MVRIPPALAGGERTGTDQKRKTRLRLSNDQGGTDFHFGSNEGDRDAEASATVRIATARRKCPKLEAGAKAEQRQRARPRHKQAQTDAQRQPCPVRASGGLSGEKIGTSGANLWTHGTRCRTGPTNAARLPAS